MGMNDGRRYLFTIDILVSLHSSNKIENFIDSTHIFTHVFEAVFTVAGRKFVAHVALRETAVCVALKMPGSSEQRIVLHQSAYLPTVRQADFRFLHDLPLRLFTVKIQRHAGDVDQRQNHRGQTDGCVLGGGESLGELGRRGERHFSNV